MNLSSELHGVSMDYESLCKAHIASYLQSAEQFLTSSSLSLRVQSWAERMAPILEEEEKHSHFDIKLYGRGILETLKHKKEEEQEQGQGKDTLICEEVRVNQLIYAEQTNLSLFSFFSSSCSFLFSVVNFSEAVQNRPRYEIARLFLATLQLVSLIVDTLHALKHIDT